jgi:antitoxin HigA-1
MAQKIKPIHPGEILFEEFLKPLKISQYRLAKDIGVPAIRIHQIVHCDRSITTNTALRLSRYFSTSALFWINLQNHYELEREKESISRQLEKIPTLEYPIWPVAMAH